MLRPDLKLLVDPVYTAKQASRCSSFYLLKKMADAFLDRFPDSRAVCLVPAPESSSIQFDVSLPPDKWQVVELPYTTDRYREFWTPTDNLRWVATEFGGIHGDWDLLITTRNNGFYYRALSSQSSRSAKFLCLHDQFPLLPFKKTTMEGGAKEGSLKWVHANVRTLSSYLAFDRVYVEPKFERDEILRASRQIFAPSMVRRMDNTLVSGFSPFDLDSAFPETRSCPDGPLGVIYFQRVTETQKRFSKVFKALRAMYAKLTADGKDLYFQVCTSSAEDVGSFRGVNNDTKFLLVEKPPRDEFYDKLRSTHVFLSFSMEEDLPKSVVEATLCGVMGVVPRFLWSLDLFGEDYPFFADDEAQAYAQVSYIHDNREKAWCRWLDWYRGYFVPTILPRATAIESFLTDVEAHFDTQDRRLAEGPNEFASKIHYQYPDHPEVDFRFPVGKRPDFTRDDVKDIPFFMLPQRWVSHYALRYIYGWRRTDSAWILKRSALERTGEASA